MRICLLIALFILFPVQGIAQDFISRGKILFEIKKNMKSMYRRNGDNNDFTSSLPEFEISISSLIFSWESSIYKREAANRIGIFFGSSSESGSVYTNLQKNRRLSKNINGRRCNLF